MIVCHRHRFIFLKTKKTAGTSVEIALSRFCGPDDIVSRIVPEDEALRRELGSPGPRNEWVPLHRYRPRDALALLRKRRPLRYANHSPAAWVRTLLPRAVWRDYFKFSIERNPWDRAISSYYWRTRDRETRPPLDEWLRSAKRSQLSNFGIYSIRGRLAVDRVLRYERLEADLQELAQELRLPEPVSLLRAKGSHRADRRPYREVLDAGQRELVARVCAREIALLGYEF